MSLFVAESCATLGQPDFFTSQRDTLHGLFAAAGQESVWSDSLPELVERTQAWVKGDHFDALNPVEVPKSRQDEVKEYFREVGMIDAHIPEGGVYDQMVILGGTMRANRERTGFGFAQLARAGDPVILSENGKVVFWAGPRHRKDEVELAPTQALLTEMADTELATDDPWLQRQLRLLESEQVVTETDQGRLSLLRHCGSQALIAQIHLRLGRARDSHLISSYQMRGELGRELVLMNALPVSRENMQGKARHTTESCAIEWAREHVDPLAHTRVLFVSNNPYIQRTTKAAQTALRQIGFTKLELVGCGPAAYDDAPKSLLFGELARLLWTVNQERQTTR